MLGVSHCVLLVYSRREQKNGFFVQSEILCSIVEGIDEIRDLWIPVWVYDVSRSTT